MGARNRVGMGLSYRPARLHRLAESIPGLLKRLQIRALNTMMVNQDDGMKDPGFPLWALFLGDVDPFYCIRR